ncbi:hypothetical protein WISP_55803 [Willisornis vidua]|uniref:Uncharacterized protein n=1 Tax=Willisornis vidua TaxID=1566151 RepID=A0ABQ9DGN6_9PASS|nr:hypothetical protein WISP_55803 [Willisornis vidua]
MIPSQVLLAHTISVYKPGFLATWALLAHVQMAVNQPDSQVLFPLATFQLLSPKPIALHGIVGAHMQDLALGLVEPHTACPDPSAEPSCPPGDRSTLVPSLV